MRLDLDDLRIHARIGGLADGRTRLVLDYPTEPRYRDAVMTALSELLRPSIAKSTPAVGGADKGAAR